MIEDKFLPEGFKSLMKQEIGEKDAEILFSALCGEPETSLRINSRKAPDFPIYLDTSPVEWCESGFRLPERPSFTSNPLLHAGVFYVQDASSMVYETIVKFLSAHSPMDVCDLCAAPGGKTTAILNALPDGSVMLANEFSATRAAILKENLCKYGYPDVIVTNTDTSKLAAMRERFDIVAVDAPCSGEGMMRKEEAARTQWSEGLIRQCSALQREILENAIEMVAPGGYLIYSTCTFNNSEDEDNAAWIANEFELQPIDTGLAGRYGIKPQTKGDIPCLRFMPGFTHGEGLFIAVFKKNGENSSQKHNSKSKKKGKKGGIEKIDPHILSTAKSWISGEYDIISHEGHLLALSPATAVLLESIPKGVRIMSAGIEIGEIKGKDLIPAHPLAMSVALAQPFPEIKLTLEDALRFLSREAITLPTDVPKGYLTLTYEGFPLGFIKNLGNRSNNLYPSEYRIRTKMTT